MLINLKGVIGEPRQRKQLTGRKVRAEQDSKALSLRSFLCSLLQLLTRKSRLLCGPGLDQVLQQTPEKLRRRGSETRPVTKRALRHFLPVLISRGHSLQAKPHCTLYYNKSQYVAPYLGYIYINIILFRIRI